MKYNVLQLVKDWPTLLSTIGVTAAIIRLGSAFVDSQTIIGNLGYAHYVIERVSHILLSVLIGLFVATHVYRYRHLRSGGGKKTFLGTLGSFLGILVTGCPSCSITLAGVIGLAGVFSALPYSGLEVKLVGLVIMFRVVYTSIRDLLVCKVSSSKKSPKPTS